MVDKKFFFQLKIAELIISVTTLYRTCWLKCKDYLIPSELGEKRADISIDIVIRNIKQENDYAQKKDGEMYLYYDPGYLEYFAVHRKLCEAMPAFDAFLMHGVVIAYEGCGYLFSAPSGVGKTTRAMLWMEQFPGSFIVNGDKPFIRFFEDTVFAYGSPWCGKENLNTNIGIPLRAIFILERTQDNEKSCLHRVKVSEVYIDLLKQIYLPQDKNSRIKTLELVQRLDGLVEIYRFKSEPSKASMKLAWETVNKNE